MSLPHITVCICTYQRPKRLAPLLSAVSVQAADGKFSFSIVVADNDRAESGRHVVQEWSAANSIPVEYCVEPEQNIALVRNKAISRAAGDYVAFIDDDELPGPRWLFRLWSACQAPGVHGVLGPVLPSFEVDPPPWVRNGKFFERPRHESGYQLKWVECRTGNVLFARSLLSPDEEPFRAQFAAAGEDMDFFRRMIGRGARFIWCNEAAVHELVPPSRCRKGFLLKRALLRGSEFPKHPAGRVRNIAKSIVAVPSYALALPVLAACGEHVLLKYLIKLCDHTARLLAFSGIRMVSERER